MSRESVKAFYSRIATDEIFRVQVQSVTSNDERSQIVKNHGYDFTQEEWEDYTIELLESDTSKHELLRDLDEKELASVIGGFSYHAPRVQPLYGVIVQPPIKHRPPTVQPLYGVILPSSSS